MEFEPRDDGGDPCKKKVCFSFEDMLRKMGRQKAGDKQQQKNGGTHLSPNDTPQQSKDGEEATTTTSSRRRRRRDCPLDRDQLGRSTWDLLHTMSVYYPDKPTEQEKRDMHDTITGISKTYPCDHCAADFRDDLHTNPPALSSRNVFARWMCEAHNRVNAKLGKQHFDCDRIMERWHDGWKDGSCDQ